MKWRDRKGFSAARVDCFQHFSPVIAGIQIAVVRPGLLLVSGHWRKKKKKLWLDQRVSSLSTADRVLNDLYSFHSFIGGVCYWRITKSQVGLEPEFPTWAPRLNASRVNSKCCRLIVFSFCCFNLQSTNQRVRTNQMVWSMVSINHMPQ